MRVGLKQCCPHRDRQQCQRRARLDSLRLQNNGAAQHADVSRRSSIHGAANESADQAVVVGVPSRLRGLVAGWDAVAEPHNETSGHQ